jgi:hypothetical protein
VVRVEHRADLVGFRMRAAGVEQNDVLGVVGILA